MDNKKFTLTAIGDSQTALDSSYGVLATQMWTASLCNRLNSHGASIMPRVFGISGNTTAQMLSRSDVLFLYDKPAIAIIYGAVNDPGASITSLQTQKNLQAICKVLKYKACGEGAGLGTGVSVNSQTDLPANSRPGCRYIVMTDTSLTGGMPINDDSQRATISGNGNSAQTVWEYRNKQAGESGWGRIAIDSTPVFSEGVSKVIILSTNYLNFTTGGDDYNASTSTGTQQPTNVTLRSSAKAAALSDSVAYCDLYSFQSMLINGGTFEGNAVASETTQGSNSWHGAVNDQHHNAYGHETVDRALYYTILAKGWLNDIK